jgi:hypothetical protein
MKAAPTNRMQSKTRYAVRGIGTISGGAFFLGVGSIILLVLAACGRFSPSAQAMAAAAPSRIGARVPFVGCRADGQLGPVDAPNGKTMVLPIATEAARRLAFYKSDEGYGVLAPRGWYCFATYGSSGNTLYVSPKQIVSADLFSDSWNGFAGPAIELASEYGGTSGRFGVARTIARVFPAHRAFVPKVIEEGIEPASEFPFGPYPKDKLTYRSQEIVEYQTPANTEGLGTNSMLRKNAIPISGVAILVGQTPDLLHLSERLSPELADLAPIIVRQVERDAMHTEKNSH